MPVRPSTIGGKGLGIDIESAASGERFLATPGHSMWMVEIAKLLKDRLGPVAAKASTRELPSVFVRTIALTNPAMKGIMPLLGVRLDASGEKAGRVLGSAPRPPEEAILASVESLVRLGLVNLRFRRD